MTDEILSHFKLTRHSSPAHRQIVNDLKRAKVRQVFSF